MACARREGVQDVPQYWNGAPPEWKRLETPGLIHTHTVVLTWWHWIWISLFSFSHSSTQPWSFPAVHQPHRHPLQTPQWGTTWGLQEMGGGRERRVLENTCGNNDRINLGYETLLHVKEFWILKSLSSLSLIPLILWTSFPNCIGRESPIRITFIC